MDITSHLAGHSGPALCEADCANVVSYDDLRQQMARVRDAVANDQPELVFCLVDLSASAIAAYLGALSSEHCVCLIDNSMDESMLNNLVSEYRPDWVIAPRRKIVFEAPLVRCKGIEELGLSLWRRSDGDGTPIHRCNKLLLPTSGSTGNPKMVRLSHENVFANAISIAEYLELQSNERPISSLPVHYSYGLSVLNSHLVSGGCLVLTERSILEPEFWDVFREHECTSFSGVPFQYTSLKRIGFERMELPTLRTMTQAGGKLSEKFITWFHQLGEQKGFRFFVMYGQTEATARISYLHPSDLPGKVGSVGRAIPGGQLTIEDSNGATVDKGEVVYRGPNVSLGYATRREDLAEGDHRDGLLRTGDIGYLDEQGLLFLTGRTNRFAKVFGLRLNLADVESAVEGEVVAVATEECVTVVHESTLANPAMVRKSLSDRFHINQSAFKMRAVAEIPLTSNGKPNHNLLREMLGGS